MYIRMKHIFLAFLCLGVIFSSTAQDPSTKKDSVVVGADRINVPDLTRHLSILASDEMSGRETGTQGNNFAARYIAKQIESYGLKPLTEDSQYLLPFEVRSVKWDRATLSVNGESYKHLWDYYSLTDGNVVEDRFHFDEIIFVGYGIRAGDMDHYHGADVRGKAILMYSGEPLDDMGHSLITGTDQMSDWSSDPRKKLETAYGLGASHVFVINGEFMKEVGKYRKYLVEPKITLIDPDDPTIEPERHFFTFISPELAKNLIGKKIKKVQKARSKWQEGKSPKAFKIKAKIDGDFHQDIKLLKTQNVAGIIKGDKNPDEYVFVTAHYDHLGQRGDDIFNGADDNGSGTSALLEMAEAMAHDAYTLDEHPGRSVVFMWVSGEEKGLLGSQYYVEHPIIPLDQTMVDVNVDMIGRRDAQHPEGDYIYVIGADRLSKTLHKVNEEVNKKHENLILDYTFNSEDDPNRFYYRSDHYNFAKNNIPVIFFFSGVHEDYHRPTDTVDKIEFDKLTKVTRHIYQLVLELANRKEKITVDH